MAVTSKLKPVVDLPVWEWMRPSPVTLAGICISLTTYPDASSRYIYNLYSNTQNYRYDTVTDSWDQVASPLNTINNNIGAACYSKWHGRYGRAISNGGGNNTIEMAALQGSLLVGARIRIVAGRGAGQERTITTVSDPIIKDRGVVTGASTTQIIDNNNASNNIQYKQWSVNQWRDYQVRVLYGSAAGTLVRPILYNNYNTITFYDVAWQAVTPWWGPIAPNTTSQGSSTNTLYQIESNIVTVDSNWVTTPDSTSQFVVLTDGIWKIDSSSVNSFWALCYYDIISDCWYQKTANGGITTAAFSTDITIEKTLEYPTLALSGTATPITTSLSGRLLGDSTLSLSANQYANYEIRILSGTGIGQTRNIITNSLSAFVIGRDWSTIPDGTSQYGIYRDNNKIYFSGSTNSCLWQYDAASDLTYTGKVFDYGTARSASASIAGFEPISIASITRTANAVISVSVAFGGNGNSSGTGGYLVGQIVTITGTTATARITSINSSGVVTGVSLEFGGAGGYTSSNGVTTAVTPTGGSGLTVNYTVGDMAIVTTSIAHPFKNGDTVTIAGATPSNYNGTFTIVSYTGTSSNTVFGYVVTGSPVTATFTAQTGNSLTDVTKNWATNEHAGKLIQFITNSTASTQPVIATRIISSNTSNTISWVLAATTPTTGVGRYAIMDAKPFAPETSVSTIIGTNAINTVLKTGIATGGTLTTLIDTTKNWPINYFATTTPTGASNTGRIVRIIAGTGAGASATITSNTSNTLTFATQSAAPDNTSVYEILDNYGVATATGTTTNLTDSTQNWPINIFAGKRVRILSGNGQVNESTISGNTQTTLSFSTIGGTPDVSSAYAILEPSPRGAGNGMVAIKNSSNSALNGKYIYMMRGGTSNEIGRYNITTEQFEFLTYFPFTETFTTGTMWVYDNADRIYIQKDATGRIMYYDLLRNQIYNSSTIPYGMGTGNPGNKMEIVTTADGLKYLYIGRHNGQEFWRTLIYW
jgi:hypothetical protein